MPRESRRILPDDGGRRFSARSTSPWENRIPTLYLSSSVWNLSAAAGGRFPDQDDFGRISGNNAVMSASGIPQITAIYGDVCFGRRRLFAGHDGPGSDGRRAGGLFLAGPALARPALDRISAEELGGCDHARPKISGTVDFKEADTTTSASPGCARWYRNGVIRRMRRSIALRSMRITTDRASLQRAACAARSGTRKGRCEQLRTCTT